MKKAILTIEVDSNLSLLELISVAKKALNVFSVTEKGTYKITQIQANRLKYKMK